MKIITQLKSKSLLLLIPIAFLLFSFQYQERDKITGKWAFSSSDSLREIEIYEQNNKFYGKIIQVSGNDEQEKVGHIMLKDLVYDRDQKKYKGVANSPSGITASSKLVFIDKDKLQVNVSKFLIINKSYTLTRIK